jgi:S-formylglutathione hydrolase FrmB
MRTRPLDPPVRSLGAAEFGLVVVGPEARPRGAGAPDDEADDLGQGAGSYLDAAQAPWSTHLPIESYLGELSSLTAENFPADQGRQGLFGHCGGGSGPLTPRRRAGYDHCDPFILSFMGDPLRRHAERLR